MKNSIKYSRLAADSTEVQMLSFISSVTLNKGLYYSKPFFLSYQMDMIIPPIFF